MVGIPYRSCKHAGVTTELHEEGAVSARAVLFKLEPGTDARNIGPLMFLTKSVDGCSKLMCCCKSTGREYDKVLISCVGPPISVKFWKSASKSELAVEMGTVKASQSSNAPVVVMSLIPFSFNHAVTAVTVSVVGAAKTFV